MKSSVRWVLFFFGIGVLLLSLYYLIPNSWSAYPVTYWRGHPFGPRTFPWGFFLGLLTVFAVGFILCNLFFPSSGSAKEEEDFCPYCGRDFQRSESLSQEPPETIK